MKLFITGGAGFIGSNFIRHILKKYPDYQVINFDKLTYAGNLDNLKDIESDPRYKFIKGDICDFKKVCQVLEKEKCDVITNFAAESISNDTYLPLWKAGKIEIQTLEELFESVKNGGKHKVEKVKNVEVINLKHKNIKALANHGGIGYWFPVKQISRHYYKGKIIQLNQKWGEIKVTPNHSIYDIENRLTTPLVNPELLALRNINHISKKEQWKHYKEKKLMSLLRIIAAYISEGSITKNSANDSHVINITNSNRKWINQLREDFELLGYNPCVIKRKGPLYQLTIVNKNFFNLLKKQCGRYSHNKFIPSFIFQLKSNFQEQFLNNLILGDGEIIKNKTDKTFRYTTVSKRLATGFSVLLTMLKFNFTVNKDNRFGTYTIVFGNDYTVSLLNKNKKEINYEGYVYDIEVADKHNFVCGVGNIVVHNTHVDRSILGARSFADTDVVGTLSLLDAARKFGIKKFLQISTDEVYGDLEAGGFAKETNCLNPSSPYSASKAGGDLIVLAYKRTYGVPILITRSSNNYGPYQYPEKIVPLFITNLLEGKKVPVYGDGGQIRDWLYVEDNCLGIDLVLHKGKIGEIYNIGANQNPEITNLSLTKKIVQALGRDESFIEYVKDRPGHDRRYAVDTSKIRALGWRPKVSFEQGLKMTIDWYKKNVDWWKKIKSGEYLEYYKKQYRGRGLKDGNGSEAQRH